MINISAALASTIALSLSFCSISQPSAEQQHAKEHGYPPAISAKELPATPAMYPGNICRWQVDGFPKSRPAHKDRLGYYCEK